MSEILLKLWAKTVKDDPQRYHPVLFHLLDVGNCAALLWDEYLTGQRKAQIATALNLDDNNARRAVIYLAAWHDIGKVAPGFQYLPTAPQFLWPCLESASLGRSVIPTKTPHGLVSAKVLLDALRNGEANWKVSDQQSALILAHIAGAHHGTFPHAADTDLHSDVLGNHAWHDARIALMKKSARLLVPEELSNTPLETGALKDAGVVAWLAGLISVADWLGSSDYFPAAGHQNSELPSEADYSQASMEQARKALTEFGWLPGFAANHTALDFPATFGFTPNALQKCILKCTRHLSGPFLAIAEAQMGTGKTEAAFAAIDAAFAQGHANGFYIALPTQATSNAMHDRARDKYLKKRQHGKLNLMLAHSGAVLKQDDLKEVGIPPEAINSGEPATDATVAAQSWFTVRKRPLLAPFGVGTIDQCLMGVLQTRHWFVRVFGLAGKVIVFDEVHAYDTYMNTLLEQLLAWLRAENCSVILLSATLPSSKRHSLLKAWGASVPANEVAYPRLTWVDENTPLPQSISVAEPNVIPQKIHLRHLSTDTDELANELRVKLTDGGCAAIICNTVKHAQETFKCLQEKLGVEFCKKEDWHLFHARMPFAWRQDREKKILHSFGKDKSQRPHRAIVVATQVIEQSLDLDFDWMASELAPVDLLLQRIGRLHRHPLPTRPALLKSPEFCLLCDGGEDGALPKLDVPDGMYSHYILLQTWLALRGRKVLLLPDDMEKLIEDVYENGINAPDGDWKAALETGLASLEASCIEALGNAKNVLIKKPKSALDIAIQSSRGLWEDDDPAVHKTVRAATRDGDPSIQVVCLVREKDQLFLPRFDGKADFQQQVDIAVNPPHDQTRALLRNALPISNKGLFHVLLAQGVPQGWKENSHLRFARVVKFCNGVAQVGGYTLRLDAKLGVVIEKEKLGT